MHINKKVTGKAMGIPAGLAIATLISIIITLAGSAATSYLISSEKLSTDAIGFASMVILAVAAAIGAWGACSFIKRMRLQVCMMAGGCFYLSLLAITALFFGGIYQGMLVTAAIIFVTCGVIAIIPIRKGKKWK